MSDFSFEIKADASQALTAEKSVEDGLDRIEAKAKSTGEAMGSAFDSLVEALALAETIHIGEEMLDSYTEIGNRLRVVTTSQENFNGVMEATLGIANDTRTAWEEQVSVYQRLSAVTDGLGLSQRQVLDLQKEIAQATKISGASSMEAGMAMRELTHAFETGALTTREYKVLMRDAPALMNELREASGKTGAEFAAMAHAGQLTAQNLIEWFGKAKDDIEAKFGKTIPTIADDLQILRNEATRFFGEAGAGAGIMQALGSATQFIATHFETFGRIILGVVEALGGMFVISQIIGLVKTLAAAIAANPIGALVTALVVGVSLLRQFGDAWETDDRVMTKAGSTAVTVGDYLRALWQEVKNLAHEIYDFLSGAWAALTDAFSSGLDAAGLGLSLREALVFVASFADAAIGIFRAIGDTMVTIFQDATTAIGLAFQTMINGMIRAANSLRQGLLDFLNETDRMAAKRTADVDAQRDYVRAFQGAIARGQSVTEANQAGFSAQYFSTPRDERIKQAYLAAGFDASGQQQAGGIGEIQIVDPAAANRLKGQLGKQLADDLGTSVVKDFVSNFLDKLDTTARDMARQRGNSITKSTLSDVKGTVAPHVPTDAENRAFEKMENALRAMLEQTNPQTEAEEKLAHAQDVLNKAIATGNPVFMAMILSHGGAAKVMQDFKNRLDDQLHPLDAAIRKIAEHTNSLRADRDEQERLMELNKQVEALKKAQGGPVSDHDIAMLRTAIELDQQRTKLVAAEQEQLKQLVGPAREFEQTLAALNTLQASNAVSAQQYARGVEKARDAFAEATPYGKTFTYGLSKGLRDVRDEVTDVAGQVRKTLVDAFHSVEDAIVDLVTTGTTDWHKMVNSMLADMTKLLLRQGISSVLPGLNLTGFATGGSGYVTGSGGTDSQVVAFRATPGEKVIVQTPEQQRAAGAMQPGGGAFSAHVVVVSNPEQAAIAAMSSRAGEKVVKAIATKNSRTISHVLRR